MKLPRGTATACGDERRVGPTVPSEEDLKTEPFPLPPPPLLTKEGRVESASHAIERLTGEARGERECGVRRVGEWMSWEACVLRDGRGPCQARPRSAIFDCCRLFDRRQSQLPEERPKQHRLPLQVAFCPLCTEHPFGCCSGGRCHSSIQQMTLLWPHMP